MHERAWPGAGVMYWAIAACAVPTYALSTALPKIAADLGVTLAQAGAVYAAASVGSFLSLLGSAFTVGHRGKETLFSLAIALLVVGTAGFAVIPSYGWLLAMGALLNGSSAVAQVMSFALLADRHPAAVVRYQNIAGIFWSAGAVLSPLLAGYLIGKGLGWRVTFALAAVFAAGSVAWLVVQILSQRKAGGGVRTASAGLGSCENVEVLVPTDPPAGVAGRGRASSQQDELPSGRGRSVLRLLRRREFDLVVLGFLCYLGAEITITGWISSFLTEVQQAPAVLAGLGLSLFWAGMGLGRMLVAAVLAQRLSAPRLLVLAMGGGAAAILAASFARGAAASLVLFAVTGLFFAAGAPTLSGFLATLFPGLSGPAMSLYYSLGQIGAIIFPALAGVIAASLGFRVGLSMPALLSLGVVGVALWFERQAGRRPVPASGGHGERRSRLPAPDQASGRAPMVATAADR
ncbi:MAG: MFS transporter [Limnochordaceae bacterium]|nr:MFS transporter [Limnochordaceae bacterium]